jgi:hypothetical protein
MEIDTIIEIMNTNPAIYFGFGIVLGYFLRGLVGFRSKKPSRYQARKLDITTKQSSIPATSSNEPALGWANAALKTVTSGRYNDTPLEQRGSKA